LRILGQNNRKQFTGIFPFDDSLADREVISLHPTTLIQFMIDQSLNLLRKFVTEERLKLHVNDLPDCHFGAAKSDW